MAVLFGNCKNGGVRNSSSTLRPSRKEIRGAKLFVFILVHIVSCCDGQQRFAMEPEDKSAILGTDVILPCRVVNKIGELQWTKDDFGLGTNRTLNGFPRYTMIGSDEESNYSLEIRNVSMEDDARYQCQVSSGLDGSPAIRSRYAHLTVIVAPDPPKIIQGAFIDATVDEPVDIECVSVGGKPAAEITWVDNHQNVITQNVKNIEELMPDGHRYISRSIMALVPKQKHHNQTFTCQAQNIADRAFRVASVHIEVKYRPKVRVFVKSGEDGITPEGTDARIGCEVDANPSAVTYQWYIDRKEKIGDYAEELLIFNVSRNQNEAIVKCEVTNKVGKGEDTTTLEVAYPPSFISRPKNGAAAIGGTVTLNCNVDGHPRPQIRWLHHEPGKIGQVKGKTANLKVKVSNETAGRYTCKASVEGYPEIEADAMIFIKGPPKIISNTTQFGIEGDRAIVECSSVSFPKPDDIRWYFQGREISFFHDRDYASLEETMPDGTIRASLVIRVSQPKHYGVYNCSVTNELGNDNIAIIFNQYRTLPVLLILIGVTSGVVMFSAFVVLVVLCYRRTRSKQQISKKPDVTVTGDTYKESDRSSNISDLKVPHTDGTYELDYSNGSDNTMGSNLKLAGLPLAGPVTLPNMRTDDPLMQFRYSNDYNDPTYNEYYKAPGYMSYPDYNQDYAPPAIRIQSSTQLDPSNNRSLQGSLTRSIDTTSTIPLSSSQSSSLQRSNNAREESDAINNLGLPATAEGQTPVLAQPARSVPGLDVRYAATYGNPYLKSNTLGLSGQVHTAKPTLTPAPPPYSAVRNSVLIPPGNGNQPSQATHV